MVWGRAVFPLVLCRYPFEMVAHFRLEIQYSPCCSVVSDTIYDKSSVRMSRPMVALSTEPTESSQA